MDLELSGPGFSFKSLVHSSLTSRELFDWVFSFEAGV